MTLTAYITSLRKLAEAATKGPWRAFTRNRTVSVSLPGKYGKTPCVVNWPGFDGCDLPLKQQKANARHIAAFSSDCMLALLALVEAYEAQFLIRAKHDRFYNLNSELAEVEAAEDNLSRAKDALLHE